jgi:spore coat polysaccharide biosynthesis protein SpsF
MLNTLGVVEVRAERDSRRLTACRRLGGKSLLEWVVGRMTESQRLDQVVVLAPQCSAAAELAELVPPNVPFVVSHCGDTLGRYVDLLEQHPTEAVVRVVAEHPFVDPVLTDRLVNTADRHSDADYVGYCSRTGQPVVRSALGVIGEWISAAALRRANRTASDRNHREHVTSFICSHPENFQLRLVPIPRELDREDLRLTIGGEEDWERTQTIFEALGPEHLDYQRVAKLLHHQPALRKRMAALNRTVGAA